MFFRLRRWLATARFSAAVSAVKRTPPMPVKPAPLAIVTMVATRDLTMYLLSMKAFYRRIGRGKIVAIIDRDSPGWMRRSLEQHFPGIELVILEDIDTGTCQRGGTWERLLYCIDRSAEEYVIQVDCDTLPTKPDLQEIVDCVDRGIAFAIGDGASIVSMTQAAANARATPYEYIGIVAERQFDRYPGSEGLKYLRGSSGLAGFSHGGFSRAQVEEFHREMEALVGFDAWRKWGSEQCASNFAVANSPGAEPLPYPAYTSFVAGGPREQAKFFHFIGSYRFAEGYFASHGRKEIESIMRGSGA
jgi:hypothetical protein